MWHNYCVISVTQISSSCWRCTNHYFGQVRTAWDPLAAERHRLHSADFAETINTSSTSRTFPNDYTRSHRECGHPRHLCNETLQTSRWFRRRRAVGWSRLRRDRIQLLVVVEIISKFAKFHYKGDEGVHTLDGTEYTACGNKKVNVQGTLSMAGTIYSDFNIIYEPKN